MSISISPYQETDRPSLVSIFKENVPEFFAPHELDEYVDYLGKYGNSYYSIRNQDMVIGGVGIMVDREKQTGSITWIFFSNSSKGTGAGTAAVNEMLDIMRSNPDVTEFRVRTSQHAFEFFERFGFRIDKTEKDYWAEGLDLYDMGMEKS